MAQHDHNLVDDDNRFIIDGGTRQLNNVSGVKPSLMQYDHNSEKFVFEMPRYIDGHDMLNCDRLEVHYTNSTSGTSKSSRVATAGVDNLTSSLQEDPEDSNKLTFEWTITQNATQLAGTLIFQFKFWCKGNVSDDVDEAEYIWHSGKYSFVEILPSLNITDDLINKYPNAIEELDMRVDELEGRLADHIGPIVIKKFESSTTVALVGSYVDSPTLSWEFDRVPEAIMLYEGSEADGEGESLPKDSTEKVLEDVYVRGDSPNTKLQWTLVAIDERGNTSEPAVTSITFANRIYYGASTAPGTYNGAFVLDLKYKPLSATKLKSFTVTANEGQYIYYCLPKRLGTCIFSYGANEGGVSLVATVDVTNGSGYTEAYYVYRSDEAGLGSTPLGVK